MASLYIHIPFTSHLSPYEDVYAEESHGPFTTYVQSVIAEMQHYALKYDHPAIETLYVGGGQPSLLHTDEIHRLLEHVYREFDAGALQESTLEISPEHATSDYLSGLRSMGFNRVSLRMHSFFQEDLEGLELTFSEEQARTSLQNVLEAGFDSFSVDVALGVPGQSHVHWAAVLERLADASVPHVSLIELPTETSPSVEDEHEEKYAFAMKYLQENGYKHYEISHFALPDHRSRHNEANWNHKNMLGLGAGAHSFWWRGLPAYRWNNMRHTRRYQALLQQRQAPLEHREALSLDDLAEEHIALRLRTADGLNMNYLEENYGIDLLTEKIEELASLEEGGLIEPIRNQRIRLTDQGKMLCDSITARLLPESMLR